MLVRGLSVNREQNSCNYDYELNRSEESEGLRFYQHRYFTGYQSYYEHVNYQEKLARVDELKKIVWEKEDAMRSCLKKQTSPMNSEWKPCCQRQSYSNTSTYSAR